MSKGKVGFHLAVFLWLLIMTGLSCASDALDAARKQVQSMSGSYYTEATWMRLMDELDTIRVRADERADWDEAITAGLLQARAYNDMRGEHERAQALLEKMKQQYGEYRAASLRQVYLMQAELCAAQGNPQAITRLIYEFQKCPAYDGVPFQYRGGGKPNEPLVIVRPGEKGSSSITVTAMEKLRLQAQVGRDQPLESIRVVDHRGKEYDLSALPWKVTLLDFWLGAWVPWRNNLTYMVDAYREYHDQGFGILGLSMDDDPQAGLALLKHVGADWPQADEQGRMIARDFGFYGEACNILVDDQGFVLARNVRGADLSVLVRKALNITESPWGHEK